MELSIFGRSAKSVDGISDVNYEAQWTALKVNTLIFAASLGAYRPRQLSSRSRVQITTEVSISAHYDRLLASIKCCHTFRW